MLRLVALTFLSIFVTACSTAEYRNTYDRCLVEGYERFPAKIRTVQSECSREVEVDTGKTECVTTYSEDEKRTVCGPLIETVTETFACEVERDINTDARDVFARSCAAQQCQQTFGNADCETD